MAGLAGLVALSALHACSAALDASALLVASEYFAERNTRVCAIYTCSTYDGYRAWKHFSARHHTWLMAAPDLHRIPFGSSVAVFLDYDCADNRWILSQSGELGLLNTSTHWLVSSGGPPPAGLAVRMDSDVTWAHPDPGAPGGVLLQQLARQQLAGPVLRTPLGTWSPGAGLRCRIRGSRNDLGGLILRAGTVVHDLPLVNLRQRLGLVEEKHVDTMARFGWELTTILSKKYNFRAVLYATESFGYQQHTENSTLDGLVGMLERGMVDIGSAGLAMFEDRLNRIDFVGPSRLWVSKIMFRHPTVAAEQGALFRPFTAGLWLCVMLVFAALALVSHSICRAHGRPAQRAWGDTFLLVAAAVGQQGISDGVDWPSWRMLVVVSLVCATLLDTHYSAAIVSSLLLPPPRTINTREDLLRSSLRFGIENISYAHNLIEMSEDPVIRSLYQKKVAPPGAARPNYFTLEEGMAKVATETFAFHSQEFQMYQLVERLFTEQDKCVLVTIPLFPPQMTYVTVAKNSPLREMFRVGMGAMREQGHLHHLRMRWHAKRPACMFERDFVNVDLATVSPAFLLLLSAALVALLLLLRESSRARQARGSTPQPVPRSRLTQDANWRTRSRNHSIINLDTRKKVAQTNSVGERLSLFSSSLLQENISVDNNVH